MTDKRAEELAKEYRAKDLALGNGRYYSSGRVAAFLAGYASGYSAALEKEHNGDLEIARLRGKAEGLAEAAPKWISTNDMMPADQQPCLIYKRGWKHCGWATWHEKQRVWEPDYGCIKGFDWHVCNYEEDDIDFWMALPAVPKEGE